MPKSPSSLPQAASRAQPLRMAGMPAAALVRELHLHEQELEAQNIELRRVQAELAAARDRYLDLYDRAPVGYLTLDADGCVLEANQTAGALLGTSAASLRGQRLSAFVAQPDVDRWHLHRMHSVQDASAHGIEIGLRRSSGEAMHCHLDCLPVAAAGAPPQLRVTLTDVTPRRQADADRRAARRAVAAQERERRRVARQLHDDLGQRLSLVKMELATLPPTGLAPGRLDAIVAVLDDTVAIARRLAAELRPVMLDDLGLSAAIDALARDAAREFGLELTLCLTAEDPLLDEQAAVALYRVMQSMLREMAAAPGTRSLVVALGQDGDGVVLMVQSRMLPGRARVPAAQRERRWEPLREEARLMGYDFALEPAPAGGESVTVRLPLADVAGRRSGWR